MCDEPITHKPVAMYNTLDTENRIHGDLPVYDPGHKAVFEHSFIPTREKSASSAASMELYPSSS